MVWALKLLWVGKLRAGKARQNHDRDVGAGIVVGREVVVWNCGKTKLVARKLKLLWVGKFGARGVGLGFGRQKRFFEMSKMSCPEIEIMHVRTGTRY